MIESTNLRVRVLLSLQKALVGEISERMCAVSTTWTTSEVFVRFFLLAEISEDDREHIWGVESELVTDLPDQKITCRLEIVADPKEISLELDEQFVFRVANK